MLVCCSFWLDVPTEQDPTKVSTAGRTDLRAWFPRIYEKQIVWPPEERTRLRGTIVHRSKSQDDVWRKGGGNLKTFTSLKVKLICLDHCATPGKMSWTKRNFNAFEKNIETSRVRKSIWNHFSVYLRQVQRYFRVFLIFLNTFNRKLDPKIKYM